MENIKYIVPNVRPNFMDHNCGRTTLSHRN